MPTNRLVIKEQIATYASVLFDAVTAAGGQEAILRVSQQIKQIVAALRENADLDESLQSASLAHDQRASLARNVFAQCEPALVDVLAVMAERKELDFLPRVADLIEQQMGDKLNLAVVDVATAVPLDDHLRDVIREKAQRELGKNVVLNESVDKTLLGGIVMSTSDERIDASIKTQVEHARAVLKKS